MIDGKNFYNQPIKTDLISYENIQKIAAGQETITRLAAC